VRGLRGVIGLAFLISIAAVPIPFGDRCDCDG